MDVNVLREQIKGCPDKIQAVLEALGFQDIKYHASQHSYFSFPRIGGDRANGTSLYCDSLRYNCWTVNDSGDLVSLVMKTRQTTLPKAIQFICNTLGIKNVVQQIHLPFGGFYKQLTQDWNKYGEHNLEYPETILDKYDGLNQMFLDDGIDLITQERFELGFCLENNTISVPIRDINGRLIGVKVRNNDINADYSQRYWADYSYSKTSVVYGLYQNYEYIVRKGRVIVVEAEKSVMQAASFGCNLVVAVGGHVISETQANILKSLMLSEYIVAFDEGIEEEEVLDECRKLQIEAPYYRNEISYIYDAENRLLPLGSKDSPTDNGRAVFEELFKGRARFT